MTTTPWADKIREYNPRDLVQLENVLRELTQLHVLAALGRTDFFTRAQFHGGTCLHIIHGMNRFSEDLDFLLAGPDPDFTWKPYLRQIIDICSAEDIDFETDDRSATSGNVKKAIMKTRIRVGPESLPFSVSSIHPGRKIKVHLEADANPPAGSISEAGYVTFPVTTAVAAQTLSSGFGMKFHALLCRNYVKGRDWYDFAWYAGCTTIPDLQLLSAALQQSGPWKGQQVQVDRQWLSAAMKERIGHIDWDKTKQDVMRFLPAREQPGLRAWGTDFFLHCLSQVLALLK